MSQLRRDQIGEWLAQASNMPDRFPVDEPASFPNIESFRIVGRSDGFDVRFRCSEGRFHDLGMNPVLAEMLVFQIFQAGLAGDWFDEDYNLKIRQ